MPNLTNIKITQNDDIKKINTVSSFKIINDQFINKFKIDLTKLLPNEPYQTVSFTLANTNSSMANAIRRVLVNELPIWSLQANISSINTDDDFIIPDELATKIKSVPISQEQVNKVLEVDGAEKNIKFNIDFESKRSGEDHYIRTNHIVPVSADIPIRPLTETQLYKIRDGRSLKMEMKLECGYAYNNAAAYSPIPMPSYSPQCNKSSLVSKCDTYNYKYNTYVNYADPLYFLKLAIKEIYRRIELIEPHIKRFYDDNEPYYRDEDNFIEIKINAKKKLKITFYKENITISDLIAKYAYNLNNSIDLINSESAHISAMGSFINVDNASAILLILDAIKKIKLELNEMYEQITHI